MPKASVILRHTRPVTMDDLAWLDQRGLSLADRLARCSIPEPNSGCLLWMLHLTEHGYAVMSWRGWPRRAARMSLMCFNGCPIPDGFSALHRCDNPPCIEPSHLFVGTDADNAADRKAKGRNGNLFGSAHPNSLLTEDDVRVIRGYTGEQKHLAARFGVSYACIWSIQSGIGWEHVK